MKESPSTAPYKPSRRDLRAVRVFARAMQKLWAKPYDPDDWRTSEHECEGCHWRGKGDGLIRGDDSDGSYQLFCPSYHEPVVFVLPADYDTRKPKQAELSDAQRIFLKA